MHGRVLVAVAALMVVAGLASGTTLGRISKNQPVYLSAQNGDVLSIITNHIFGTDPDYVYVYGPDGKLQERLEITTSTTTQVTLNSGDGVYKVLPVNFAYAHIYSIPGSVPMVVQPFAHQQLIRVNGVADLFFYVPAGTPAMTFFAHSMTAAADIQEQLYDPNGSLVHTFTLSPNTFQESHEVSAPMAGFWRCRFSTSLEDRCGAWLEGVPNFFASSPSAWFEPSFGQASAQLVADLTSVVSDGARVGVNWWINPSQASAYEAELDAVCRAGFDTARITVDWRWREPANDNGDPFDIYWPGFSFGGHDVRMAAYYDDVTSVIPDAMPVLLFYWSPAVSWQSENPALWTATQREEFAEFVLATMIHTVAPDLQDTSYNGPAYPFEWVELLNEPNLWMGSTNYQAYIDIVTAVGQRLRAHSDPRINSLKIVAPGIGWVWGAAASEMENWVGKLIDQADPYLDGVNWHQYDYLRIEEHDRFAEDLATVRSWLGTRGDGTADERFLMTETNQHGGSPTCWKRQDTFYGSRWWAATTLSALRGGVHFIQYYKLVDDPPGSENYKGMMFNDGPYDPPLFPGGPPHGDKPVLEAASFINRYRHELVVASSCDHPEISHLVTLSQDHTALTILAANLLQRAVTLDLELVLPSDMQNMMYAQRVYNLNENGQSFGGRSTVAASTVITAVLELEPESISAVVLRSDAIFGDGFDSGDATRWSGTEPPAPR